MTEQSGRLERLVAAELGECCEGDVEARVDELRAYAAGARPAGRELAALRVLGDETRHTIVRLLTAAEGALCVCEITPVVDVGDSATSHALADLREAGLVSRRKEGTWRYYEATSRARALLDALDRTGAADD